MTNAYITGITGKTGHYLLRALESHADELGGWTFHVSVRASSDTRELDETPLRIVKHAGDLTDAAFIDAFLDAGDANAEKVLLHIAGINYSLALADAAIRHDFSRLILVHTTGIYSKYKKAGERKRQIEKKLAELLAGRDIPLSILRPTMIYGTLGDKNVAVFMRMADRLRLFPVVSGAKYELQPVWCGDLGRAYCEILLRPEKTRGKDYILSGGAPIRLIDLLRVLEKGLGRRNVYFSVPFPVAYAAAVCLYGVTFGRVDYREKVQRLVEPRCYPHDDAARDFGYAPVRFEDGVQDELRAYLRKRGA